MSRKRYNNRNIVIPNGSSENEIGSSESEDEMSKVAHALRDELNMTADFADNLPPPLINDELEPIDYFYFMFGKAIDNTIDKSIKFISCSKGSQQIEQRFFWSNTTRVESISSVMSRDRFLEIKKYLHVVDNSVQPNRTDANCDRAHKEEKLSVDQQIIPFKDIATVWLKASSPPRPRMKRGRPSLQIKSNENNSTTTARTAPSPAPSSSIQFDKFDYWPSPTSKGRCRNPGCTGYTRISCSKCELRLYLNDKNNCYTDYHS
ncbi:unnamed protein product [Rotaria magnacalcarata]|uniref:PiggyBac transposable element-derived protein domain-containing protein n=2 Tax=Rotaria magnacalcarata TaxID=392030 RepID=A0A820BDE6_9BILA|nr:unnamed protein product [Rotaria magnacalcarata]CAF4190864.1 unnamed protein product [Rotaria magnacalcarata]